MCIRGIVRTLNVRFAILFFILLAACQSRGPTPFVSPVDSPLQLSPLATPVPPLEGPNFSVNPVKAGDITVSGQGPIGLPIVIVDVTLSAEPLARTVIDSSGNFRADLSEPAVSGHVIGIQVVDLAGTPYEPTDEFVAQLDAKAGEGFRYYPQIGAVYASIMVTP